MVKKVLFFVFLFLISVSAFAVTKTAASGDWNVAGTWSPAGVPGSGDDVIIPLGVTVTSAASITSIKSITINGTLTITGDLTFGDLAATYVYVYGTLNVSGRINFNNGWGGGDILTVESGGIVNITGNLEYNKSSTGTFKVLSGGSAYITGNVNAPLTTIEYITNDGYIEITGNIAMNVARITNNTTGTILAHGSVSGLGSGFEINNYGLFTIDKSTNMDHVLFTNYSSGKFLVFGDITYTTGSTFTNSGLVQCNKFTYIEGAGTFNNSAGTLITLGAFDIPFWGGCPCLFSLGQFYVNSS